MRNLLAATAAAALMAGPVKAASVYLSCPIKNLIRQQPPLVLAGAPAVL